MYYSVAGRTVLIVAHDDWSTRAVSQIFAGWFLNPIPTEDNPSHQATIEIRCGVPLPTLPSGLTTFEIANDGKCYTDDKEYHLDFDGSLIVFDGSSTNVHVWVAEPFEIESPKVTQLLSHALSPAMRRCEIFELHSAGVIPPGKNQAIMIAGSSGSGKSTLTSLLASSGWRYMSDDILLLRERGSVIEAQAFRRFFALTAETMSVVRLSQPKPDPGGKKRVIPEHHFGSQPTESASPVSVIFPRITGESESRVVPLNTAESMSKLIRLSPWATYDKPTSTAHLKMLGQLANSTTAFTFEGGDDILKDPTLAARLILAAVSETVLTH